MTDAAVTFRNGRVFYGTRYSNGQAIRFENEQFEFLGPEKDAHLSDRHIDLGGDFLLLRICRSSGERR